LLRGGYWNSFSFVCRASQRYAYPPDTISLDSGFRAARNP
jgi:formylglycine-generating enzyme required for sulfatase activity